MRRLSRLVILGSALALAPTNARAQLARADSAFADGNRALAEREYAAVIARDPSQSRAVFRLAQLREKRDRALAIPLYRQYVALEPRDAWGYIALGDALGAQGELGSAMAAYDQALRIAPAERDVHVGRARLLGRAGHVDDAIVAWEQWVARTPRDTASWRELSAQQRRAGRYSEAEVALQRAGAKPAELEKVRRLQRGAAEPLVVGSRDSDGLTTMRAGATATSPLLGRARVSANASSDRASDGIIARASLKGNVGVQFRPLAQLRLEANAGVARADQSFIDTIAGVPITGRRGRVIGVGKPTVVGKSAFETIPVGRARLVWRVPGDAFALDARVGRQMLDASPALIAQGVLRDEANVQLDLRVAGPVRVRGFGRMGSVHNAQESNGRRIVGGALAYVPGPYELTLRGQNMEYDHATTLAYNAPRSVRMIEATTYIERETDSGITMSFDLGAGGQQVADWTTTQASWSPSFRGWAQMLVPMNNSLSVGTELEAYDSKVGTDTPSSAFPAAKWKYGSASVWLRVAF